MRKIFCFIDTQESFTGKLKNYIENADAIGDEVHLYTDFCRFNYSPNDILAIIDSEINLNEKNTDYIFLSNIKNLFFVVYRLYHQIFNCFIYYNQPNACNYELTGVYKQIQSMNFMEKERLTKPIYTNEDKLLFKNCRLPVLDYELILQSTDVDDANRTKEKVRKYYRVHGYYYLFEPVLSEHKIVIDTDKKDTAHDSVPYQFPGFGYMQYEFSYDEEMLNHLFSQFDMSLDHIQNIPGILDELSDAMHNYPPFYYVGTCCIMDDASQLINPEDIVRSLLLLSYLMIETKKPYYFDGFLKITIDNPYLSSEDKYSIWHQCKRNLFIGSVMESSQSGQLLSKLYDKVFYEYYEGLSDVLEVIPKEERNKDIIVIFTVQFLSEKHAPSRTALERCYTLAKAFGKKILLINTKEMLTRTGFLPMYKISVGNMIEEYSNIDYLVYHNVNIPFYQPKEDMPSVPAIRKIIHMVREVKPYLIFSIGNGSITADLCGQIVPEAAMGVVFSNLTFTKGTFSVIGRKIADAEWDALIRQGYQKSSIIESTFTFELLPKKRTITRDYFNLPEDRFVLVTVGTRLDDDINDEFIEVIQNTFQWGTFLVFAGNFTKYNVLCDRYPELKNHSACIGYYDDVLSLMEICDLYVNPRRSGGGFSIVEAFHEGIPGVTINTGDVAIAAGDDFCVNDYNEMLEMIKKYKDDRLFYNRMSEKALAREKVVTDSAAAMKDIIDKIQNNPLFF